MAIKIPVLQELSNDLSTKKYIYKDLKLDVSTDFLYDPITERVTAQNDITASHNIEAISNSLRNLFTTRKGERFLFPLYGLDLRQYLFSPISEINARAIGNEIVSTVKKFEPRVAIKKCLVVAAPDDNTYEIDLIVEIPAFKTTTTINSILDVRTAKFAFTK